jgi:hypothetical protein
MIQSHLKTLVVALAISTGAIPAVAHHSGSMFDDKKEVTLTGVVREFQYTNPHSWLLVDVKGPDGKVTTWGFETNGPTMLLRAGIRKGDFAPGTPVTITGHPLKDGRPAATWTKAIRRTDKKEFIPREGRQIR